MLTIREASDLAAANTIERHGGVLEDVRIADVPPLGEVGPQEALLHGLLVALLLGQPQHLVGEEGVGPLRPLEVEVQPHLGRHRRDAVDELDGLLLHRSMSSAMMTIILGFAVVEAVVVLGVAGGLLGGAA